MCVCIHVTVFVVVVCLFVCRFCPATRASTRRLRGNSYDLKKRKMVELKGRLFQSKNLIQALLWAAVRWTELNEGGEKRKPKCGRFPFKLKVSATACRPSSNTWLSVTF